MKIFIIILIIVIIFLFFTKKKKENNVFLEMENELQKEMKALLFEGKTYDEHIELVAFMIFSICLKKAGKRITVPEIIDPNTLMKNVEVLDYLALYESLKDTLKEAPHLIKVHGYGSNRERVTQQVLIELIPSTIVGLSKLKNI